MFACFFKIGHFFFLPPPQRRPFVAITSKLLMVERLSFLLTPFFFYPYYYYYLSVRKLFDAKPRVEKCLYNNADFPVWNAWDLPEDNRVVWLWRRGKLAEQKAVVRVRAYELNVLFGICPWDSWAAPGAWFCIYIKLIKQRIAINFRNVKK